MVIKYIETVLVGSLSKPFTISHHSTKSMMVAASLLVARHRGLLALPHEDLFHIVAAAVLLLRMLDNLGSFKTSDPYKSLENMLCSILFGEHKPDSKPSVEKKKE